MFWEAGTQSGLSWQCTGFKVVPIYHSHHTFNKSARSCWLDDSRTNVTLTKFHFWDHLHAKYENRLSSISCMLQSNSSLSSSLVEPGGWGLVSTHCCPQFRHFQQTWKEFNFHTDYSVVSEQIKPLHLFLCHFSLRDQWQWMIERLSKATGAALVGRNFLPIPLKISFHMKKKWLIAAQYLQSIKTFFALELTQWILQE